MKVKLTTLELFKMRKSKMSTLWAVPTEKIRGDHPPKHSNNADQNAHPVIDSTMKIRDECCVVSWRCKWIEEKWIIWHALKCIVGKVQLGYTSELEWYGSCNMRWEKWIMEPMLWVGDGDGLELDEYSKQQAMHELGAILVSGRCVCDGKIVVAVTY